MFRSLPPARFLLLFLILCALPGGLRAQTGATLPSGADLAASSDFAAAPAAEEVTGVDLRHYFPPVGTQSMNDCAAWAVSAAKSAAEAFDQGWEPNKPQTMFSPAFIYPQLNNGKDDGSSLVKAALLLIEKGAATLKTTPYIPKDYKTQPPPFAFEEALRFKNKDAYLLKDQEQIRLALRENLPVVIGARLTPNFFGGNFDKYTKELHTEGMKRRDPKRAHSMHAMVIVGYDDPSQRFLIRNSWGPEWGKGGYCWVSYDVIEGIDPSPESETFLFVALAMVDELADAEATPDVGEDLKDAIRLGIRGEPAGYDANFKKTKYRFTANLKGPQTALDLVKDVRWAVPTWNGKVKTLLAKSGERGFRVLSSVGGEVHEIGATVTFKDGSTKAYKTTTAFTPMRADDRPITMTSEDFYYGKEWVAKLNRMADTWTRVVRIEGPSQDIRDIETMSLQVGDDEPEDISPSAKVWEIGNIYLHEPECRPLRLHITFADGTQTDRLWDIPQFEDPLDDGIWMKKAIRPVGDGEESAYTLSIRAPVGLAIKDIIWELDGTQKHFYKRASASEWHGYPISGSAYRDFRARATVRFLDLANRPDVVLEEWIELPDKGTEYPTAQRLEVRQDSTYMGRDGKDRPEWKYDLRLTGDWKATAGVQGATFSYMDLDGAQQTVASVRDEKGDWTASLFNMPRELDLVTAVKHKDGPVELRNAFQSDKPIVDGVFLETQTTFDWKSDHADRFDWGVQVGGSRWFSSLEKVAYLYDALMEKIPERDWRVERELKRIPRPWQTVYDIKDGALMHRATMRRSSAVPGAVQARLYYNNGSMEVTNCDFTQEITDWSGAPKDRVQLRALEYFLGANKDIHCWAVKVWLSAPQEELDKIEHLLFRNEALPWGAASRIAPSGDVTARFSHPGAVVARIVRKDGSVEERRIEVTCQSQRIRSVELMRNGNLIVLRGPRNETDGLASVTFRIQDKDGAETSVKHSKYLYAMGDFGAWYSSENELNVAAEMEFKDGSKRTISAVLPPTQAPATRAVGSDRFWGWYEDKPYWLSSYRILGGAWKGQSDATWMKAHWLNRALSNWPDFEFHRVIATPEKESITLTYRDQSEIKLGPYETPLDSPIYKELSLEVRRNWENPRPDEMASDEYLYRIVGPLKWLDEVLEVDYKAVFKSGAKSIQNTWHETSRWSLDGDGFRGISFAREMLSVEATLHFRDGREPQILNWTSGK